MCFTVTEYYETYTLLFSVRHCPEPVPEVDFTDASWDSTEYGSSARYDCITGHEFPGGDLRKTVTCLATGEWEVQAENCQRE